MGYFIEVHVHIPLNIMGLPKEKIVTCWKFPDQLCLLVMFLTLIRVKPFLHPHFLSIMFLPNVLKYRTPISELLSVFPSSRVHNSLEPCVFGCVVFVRNVQPNRCKLDPKALKCVFLGYSSTQKRYKCYHPPTKCLLISCDVSFVEDQTFYSQASLQGENDTQGDKYWDPTFSEFFPLITSTFPSQSESKNGGDLDQGGGVQHCRPKTNSGLL